MKLRLSTQARHDITEIGRYIRARNPTAALAVREAIRHTMKMLTIYPHAGRTIGDDGLHRFVVPRLPYLIFYVVDVVVGELQVVTVRHAARDEID